MPSVTVYVLVPEGAAVPASVGALAGVPVVAGSFLQLPSQRMDNKRIKNRAGVDIRVVACACF